MYNTLVVNIFGGAGIGKSTAAALLVGELKKHNVQAEYIQEYIKDVIYTSQSYRVSSDDRKEARKLLDGSLLSQAKIFQAQKRTLDIKVDQVQILVTDAPLPLNIIYLKEPSEYYTRDVISCFMNEYHNLNFVLSREKDALYQTEGRIHTEEESIQKDKEILDFLKTHGISYSEFDRNNIEAMVSKILVEASISVSKTVPKENKVPVDTARTSESAQTSSKPDLDELRKSARDAERARAERDAKRSENKPVEEPQTLPQSNTYPLFFLPDNKRCNVYFVNKAQTNICVRSFIPSDMQTAFFRQCSFNSDRILAFITDESSATGLLDMGALKELYSRTDIKQINPDGNDIKNYVCNLAVKQASRTDEGR